jgi:hypothetical protein
MKSLCDIVRAVFYPSGRVIEVQKYSKNNFAVVETNSMGRAVEKTFVDSQRCADKLIKKGDIQWH